MNYTLQDVADKPLTLLLDNTIKHYAGLPAVGYAGEEMLSYRQLGDKTIRLAFHLAKHGIGKGDKVAIWSANSPHWVVAFFSLMKIGAVAVPVLPDFSTTEVLNILKHSGTKFLFTSSALYRKIDDNIKNTVDTIVLLNDFALRQKKGNNLVKGEALEPFCSGHEHEIASFQGQPTSGDELASIIYTSGTTGTSKGVMLSHKNLFSNVVQASRVFDVKAAYKFLSVLPMSHTYEFTLGTLLPLSRGASIHYLRKPPTAPVLLPALRKVQPEAMLTVPLIIEKIYKSKIRPEFSPNTFKGKLYHRLPPLRKLFNRIAGKRLLNTFGGKLLFFGIGGAKLDTQTEKFLKEARFPYAIGYGLTETSPLIAGTNAFKTKVGSTGPKVIGVDMKLINKDEKTGEGEIVVKGPNVMAGYYRDEQKTAEVFTNDGYFRTGDTGIFDKDAYLFIRGRIKNMILGPAGENIFPEEIESMINQSEWVLESLVSQVKGQLVARVQIDYEALEKHWDALKISAGKAEDNMEQWLADFKKSINQQLNRFSRLSKVMEQKEEFIKTPTKKIKRYLYEKDDKE